MKKLYIILILSITVLGNYISAKTKASQDSFVPDVVLVKFAASRANVESSGQLSTLTQKYGILEAKQLFGSKPAKRRGAASSRIYKLTVPVHTNIPRLCQVLQQESFIEYAEPDYICSADAIPNDSLYSLQSHLPQIYCEQAWDIATGSPDIIVAIVGTGVDWNHPDLSDAIWSNPGEVADGIDNDGNGFIDDIRGWDFVEGQGGTAAAGEDGDIQDNDPMDFNGHETHCAGLAAAVSNNSRGVASVSWGCTIMPVRAGYQNKAGEGKASSSALAEAIEYAAENGAHFINFSWSGGSNTVAEMAKEAFQQGALVVNSAGNEDNKPGVDPTEIDAMAALPCVLTVASVDDRDHKATYSSYGPWVTVSAPGGDQSGGRPGLLSTIFDDRYEFLQGTSMAAPVVTGLAGLVKSYHPDWTAADVLFQIAHTTDNIDALNPRYQGMLGTGRVNAWRALTESVTVAPKFEMVTYTINDTTTGNGNGLLDIGETAQLIVTLRNNWGDALDVTAILVMDDPEIQILNNISHLGYFYGLRNITESVRSNRLEAFLISVDSGSIPRRLKGAVHVSADGLEWNFPLTIAIDPKILLIDDDSNSGVGPGVNVQDYYTEALDAIDVPFDVWDVAKFGYQYAGRLKKYRTLIWFCEKALPSLDLNDRYNLERYFNDRAGNIVLFGQDIGWDLNDASDDSNSYALSQGTSKQWYEKYLSARYIANTSMNNRVIPAHDDPIGNGIAFNFTQPDRDPMEQSPSVVDPLNNGIACLKYADGTTAAVRSAQSGTAGDFKTAYFFFGGIEAIQSPEMQQRLLAQTVNWINNIRIEHVPMHDIPTPQNCRVELNIQLESDQDSLARVDLAYTVNGQYPAQLLPMTPVVPGVWSATIPAVESGVVEYSFIVKTSDGLYAPRQHYQYKIGADTEAPVISYVERPHNMLNSKEPFSVLSHISDNTGVDHDAVFAHYWSDNTVEDSVLLRSESLENFYSATFSGNFMMGEQLYFYLSAQDIAVPANRVVTKIDTIILGLEDFENELGSWQSDESGSWGLEKESPNSGYYRLADSPNALPRPDLNTTLSLKTSLDFSQALDATLSFWSVHALRFGRDYGYVEISVDSGMTWIELAKLGGIKETWYRTEISLKSYTGIGFENVLLRLRLNTKSGAISDQFKGWSVDDISILESRDSGVTEDKRAPSIPDRYGLGLNYPNPFNPATTISYQIPKIDHVAIEIRNVLGQCIRTLVHQKQAAGRYQIVWDGTNDAGVSVGTGIYLTVMTSGNYHQVRKILLLK